jgi:hypothetical protein
MYVDTCQLDRLMALFVDDLMFDETRIGGAVAHGKADLGRAARRSERHMVPHHVLKS